MGRAFKSSLTAALLLVALVVFAFTACGNHGVVQGFSPGTSVEQKTSPEGLPAPAAGLDYQNALADLDALPCPEGVDAKLWAELKEALEEALQAGKTPSRPGSPARLLDASEDSGAKAPRTGVEVNHGRDARATKIVAAPPTGEANHVKDLAIADNGDGTFTLTWHYRNLGDYDQNGVVAVEDIIPLAEHFGETWVHGEENSLTAVIDGSGNGRVGIEDITPIAANIAVNVHHYAIEGADTQEGPWEAVGELEQSTGGGEGRLAYEHVLNDAPYRWYRVVPGDGEGTPGEPSGCVLSPAFQEWVHTWGGDKLDRGCDITVDVEGNVYVTGFAGSFGAGQYDVILLKYSPDGQLLWRKTWGGSDDDFGRGLVVDKDGSVFVTGASSSFGSGEYDLILLKYSSTGTLLWQRTWGGSGYEYGEDIAVDSDGDLHVTGYVYTVDALYAVLLRYSSDGNLLKQRAWGGSDADIGYGVAVDCTGAVYVTGQTYSFGAGDFDVFVLKYSTNDALLWQRTWGGSELDSGRGVAVASNGDVYVMGTTNSFGTGMQDIVLLKYAIDGTLLWQRTWGGGTDDYSTGVAVDGRGNVCVTGWTEGFGYGVWGIILLKYSSSGSLLWEQTWGRSGRDAGHDVTTDSDGNVYLTGEAYNTCGLWRSIHGTENIPIGTQMSPNGIEATLYETETVPNAVEAEPEGVEDGSNGLHVLVMKLNP